MSAPLNNRQAVILAGGRGTRLRPYTMVLPKPLVPIGERPILEIIVRQLREHGFTNLVFAVNHMAELVRSFFGDGSKWGTRITYSLEDEPMGTAGPIGLLEDLQENFLVMNGDVLTDIDYGDLMRVHMEKQPIATVATCIKKVPISLGVLDVSPEQRLVGYTEKPVLQYCVSMGIYILNRRILQYIARDRYLDLPNLMQTLIQKGEAIHCYDYHGRWLDIGNPGDLQEAVAEFERSSHGFLNEPPAAE